MRRYRCEVIITSEVIVEIDDEKLEGDGFINQFSSTFYPCSDWKKHAGNIAVGNVQGYEFIEGYGVPLINGAVPFGRDEVECETSINIIPVYDDEISVETEEI